jgi:hypothetical protein
MLERKVQVDELALATLGYLVLPIKSPGLKNRTCSLPCPCPRVFYVSELCPLCCQITSASPRSEKLVLTSPHSIAAIPLGRLGVWVGLDSQGRGDGPEGKGPIWSPIPGDKQREACLK